MSFELKLTSIAFLLVVILIIASLVVKRHISVKYSFVWLLPCFLLLIFVLVPGILSSITNLFGFQTASNMIFAILIGFLMIIDIALTVIVSKLNEKVRLLVQEVSLLRSNKKHDK